MFDVPSTSISLLSVEEQGDLVEEVSVNESLNDTTFLGAAKGYRIM